MPFAEYRGLADTVLELEITPNRPDCLSVAGVAREVGAGTGKPATRAGLDGPQEAGAPVPTASSRVTIDDADAVPALHRAASCATSRSARRRSGSPSGSAPSGARPINNVVDVTNYVMFELGQPLHAFDARRSAATAVGASDIHVRLAEPGERLTTLDGVERPLATDTLVIADPAGPVALAGVMGGARHEVTDGTVDIVLESACFLTASVGRTSRRLGLISEASLRFERGVDPNGCAAAADRAAQLLTEVAGGRVAAGTVDVYPSPVSPARSTLRPARLNALLGTAIPTARIAEVLERLGLAVRAGKARTPR